MGVLLKAAGRVLVLGTSVAVGSMALGYWARRKEAEAMFKSPRLVSAGLRSLGYDIKADVGPWREASQEDIARFQADYNLQARKLTGESPWYDANAAAMRFFALPTHGVLTPSTRMALMFALEQQSSSGVPFRDVAPVIIPDLIGENAGET